MAVKIKIIRKEKVTDLQAAVDAWIASLPNGLGKSQVISVEPANDPYGQSVVITYDDGS